MIANKISCHPVVVLRAIEHNEEEEVQLSKRYNTEGDTRGGQRHGDTTTHGTSYLHGT